MRTASKYALAGYRLRWAYAALWLVGAYLYWDFYLALSIEQFLDHDIVDEVFDAAHFPLEFVIWFWAGEVVRSNNLTDLFNMLNDRTSRSLVAITTPCVLVLSAWLFMRSSREKHTRKVAQANATFGSAAVTALACSAMLVGAACLFLGWLNFSDNYSSRVQAFFAPMIGDNWNFKSSTSMYPFHATLGRIFFVASFLLLAFAVFILLLLPRKRRQNYWLLERRSLLLTATSLIGTLGILGMRMSNPDSWYWNQPNYSLAVPNAFFLFTTVLLWAFGCRVLLLFRLHRAMKEAAAAEAADTLCFACGYDLRGSLAGGRTACPECGAPALPAQLAMINKTELPTDTNGSAT